MWYRHRFNNCPHHHRHHHHPLQTKKITNDIAALQKKNNKVFDPYLVSKRCLVMIAKPHIIHPSISRAGQKLEIMLLGEWWHTKVRNSNVKQHSPIVLSGLVTMNSLFI